MYLQKVISIVGILKVTDEKGWIQIGIKIKLDPDWQKNVAGNNIA
jgi:hypothetical protein